MLTGEDSQAELNNQLDSNDKFEKDDPKATPVIQNQTKIWSQLAYIFGWSILGVYLRIILSDNTPAPFVSYLSSQFVGSFALGFLNQFKNILPDDFIIGFTTGFCGSLTTFSSWQSDIFIQILPNAPGTPSTPSAVAYQYFQNQLIGIAVPFSGLYFGKHLGKGIESKLVNKYFKNLNSETLEIQISVLQVFIFFLFPLIGVIIGAIYNSSTLTFSLCYAPFGASLRFFFGKTLNPISKTFYFGTFASNMLGVIVYAIAWGISTMYVLDPLSCFAIWGLIDGFCGSLSTVSSFVNELSNLEEIHAYVYGFTSVICAQLFLLIIMGSFIWTQTDPFTNPNLCVHSS